jgi:hypothetical protein
MVDENSADDKVYDECEHLRVDLDDEEREAIIEVEGDGLVSSNPMGIGDEEHVLLLPEQDTEPDGDAGDFEQRADPCSRYAFDYNPELGPPRTVQLPRTSHEDMRFAHPSTHRSFYERAQPWLWPCGVGGPELLLAPENHPLRKLSRENFANVLFTRGLDRRYEGEPLYYFAVYRYLMSRRVGGVTLKAAREDDSSVPNYTTQADPLESDETVDAALSKRHLAPEELSKEPKEIRELVRRLKTFGKSLPGTQFFTQYHRTLLLGKIANPYVTQVGTLQWFCTFAPADVLNDRMFVSMCLPSWFSKEERAAYWDGVRHGGRGHIANANTIMRQHPALQCRFFKWKQDTVWDVFIKPKPAFGFSGVFGAVSDLFRRIEFQARGTPHEHSLVHVARCVFQTVYDRCFQKAPRVECADAVLPSDAHKAVDGGHGSEEARARVESAVQRVVTTNLEPRLPGDETHMSPLASTKCTNQHDNAYERCPRCKSLVVRKHERENIETNFTWQCAPKLYFGNSDADYDEHKRHRESTTMYDPTYSRITREDLDDPLLRAKLEETWKRRRRFDDLEDPYAKNGRAPEPVLPADPHAAKKSLEELLGTLWDDETSKRYRNWQISNQCHACRKTCFKYDKHLDPRERECRFGFPFEFAYGRSRIFVDRDKKNRNRLRVLPPRNNAYVNNSFIDVALSLFHGGRLFINEGFKLNFKNLGNLDAQFVANQVGASEYTCCYSSKHEAPDMVVFNKIVAKKMAELSARCALTDRERLRTVANAMMTATEIGATQAMYTILKFPFVVTSRAHMNINPLDRAEVTRTIVRVAADEANDDAHVAADDDSEVRDHEAAAASEVPSSHNAVTTSTTTSTGRADDYVDKRITSLTPNSQFGRRHVYGRLRLRIEDIFRADEDATRSGGHRRFKRPHQFDPDDPNRDDAITMFNLYSFYNVVVLKKERLARMRKSNELDELILSEPLAMDADGWPKPAFHDKEPEPPPEVYSNRNSLRF